MEDMTEKSEILDQFLRERGIFREQVIGVLFDRDKQDPTIFSFCWMAETMFSLCWLTKRGSGKSYAERQEMLTDLAMVSLDLAWDAVEKPEELLDFVNTMKEKLSDFKGLKKT